MKILWSALLHRATITSAASTGGVLDCVKRCVCVCVCVTDQPYPELLPAPRRLLRAGPRRLVHRRPKRHDSRQKLRTESRLPLLFTRATLGIRDK